MRDQGHLFVVRGKLESVYCDAVVVPTDSSFEIESIWDGVLIDVRRPRQLQNGFTRSLGEEGRPSVWYVDVTDNGETNLDALIEHLAFALRDAAAANLDTARARPLVAIPALGLRGGGHHGEAGAAIERVMETLEAEADGIDVVFVLFSESDYAAAQWIRRRSGICEKKDALHETQSRLAGLARTGGLSLLIGAGVSIGAGLPGWNDLLRGMSTLENSSNAEDRLRALSPLDQAEYLKVVHGNKLGQRIAEQIESVKRPALGHLLLASLRCRAVATTNYDTLYEEAVKSQEGALKPTLLPYGGAAHGEPWLLKLHGDGNHSNDIVIARSEFVAYDAKNAPAGAVFQSMLLTTHLLAVGVSFTDDNILRLTHEVADFAKPSETSERREYGTVLSLGGDVLREKIWAGTLNWVTIGEPGADSSVQARQLEIFLDHVAMHANVSSSYLLDPRYAALTSDNRDVIEAARSVAAKVPAKPAAHDRWKPLRDTLAALGYARSKEE